MWNRGWIQSYLLLEVFRMKRICMFMIFVACPVVTLGKAAGRPINRPYRRLRPRSTAEAITAAATTVRRNFPNRGPALQGMAQVISSAGEYNLATSAAAINMTQAQSNYMHNRVQGVQTFRLGHAHRLAEREKERGPRPTPEELARRAGPLERPDPLNASQIDPGDGGVVLAGAFVRMPASSRSAAWSTSTLPSG